jgi:gluconate 2-dehydrogenase gamma chain
MATGDIPRRKFIAASAAGITAVWLGAKWLDLERASTEAARSAIDPTYRFQTFTATQAADIEAFAAQIIPSEDGSPGAREAHVVYFMDHVLANVLPELRPRYIAGLKNFQALVARRHKGRAFAQLSSGEQEAMVRVAENSKSDFFEAMRVATIKGMFANPEYGGNFNKHGWALLGFQDRFFWRAPFGYYDAEPEAHA